MTRISKRNSKNFLRKNRVYTRAPVQSRGKEGTARNLKNQYNNIIFDDEIEKIIICIYKNPSTLVPCWNQKGAILSVATIC